MLLLKEGLVMLCLFPGLKVQEGYRLHLLLPNTLRVKIQELMTVAEFARPVLRTVNLFIPTFIIHFLL